MADEHKIKKDERTQRIETIGANLQSAEEQTGDFEEDLKEHFLVNKVIDPVKNLLHSMIAEIKG